MHPLETAPTNSLETAGVVVGGSVPAEVAEALRREAKGLDRSVSHVIRKVLVARYTRQEKRAKRAA